MASPISIYLSDDVLRMLDAMVEQQAADDRSRGLEGRQVTSRSKLISGLIRTRYEHERPLDIETIRYHVVDLAESYGAAKASLFGSYATGTQQPSSDVDILLDKGEIRGMQVLDFQQELSEKLGRAVDVVTTAGASDRFLSKIAPEAITLYEAA